MREQLAKLSRRHELAKPLKFILKRSANFTLLLSLYAPPYRLTTINPVRITARKCCRDGAASAPTDARPLFACCDVVAARIGCSLTFTVPAARSAAPFDCRLRRLQWC